MKDNLLHCTNVSYILPVYGKDIVSSNQTSRSNHLFQINKYP